VAIFYLCKSASICGRLSFLGVLATLREIFLTGWQSPVSRVNNISFSSLYCYRPNVSRSFSDLSEREVLALAISLEEEDSRIYRDYAERMKEKYPETASILQSMHEVELSHHRRLIEVFHSRFGDHVPYLRRHDVKGFIKRKPIWLNIHLKPKRVRQDVMGMEAESRRFYQEAVNQVKSSEVRVLLQELAAVEEEHQDIFVEEVRKKKKSGALAKEDER
jgi:erythrin-vacuolar iron transport family protein